MADFNIVLFPLSAESLQEVVTGNNVYPARAI